MMVGICEWGRGTSVVSFCGCLHCYQRLFVLSLNNNLRHVQVVVVMVKKKKKKWKKRCEMNKESGGDGSGEQPKNVEAIVFHHQDCSSQPRCLTQQNSLQKNSKKLAQNMCVY